MNSSKLESARAYCMIRLNSTYFYIIVCYAHMNIFFICAIFFIYYWCIEFWSQVRNVGCEVEGLCFVHTSIKKFPWVTLQGSRIVLVISYPATLKRDMIATATYGDRHHQIDHPRRRHLLILKVRQKHIICQCRQINSLVNLKFFTRVLRLGTCFLITIIFDLYCHFFKVRISQTIANNMPYVYHFSH